jgi:hypothetical protein
VPLRLAPDDTERLKKNRKKRPSLTEIERQRLRSVLKNLRHLYGTWKRVAEATGVSEDTLCGVAKGRDFGSMSVAVLAARAARLIYSATSIAN